MNLGRWWLKLIDRKKNDPPPLPPGTALLSDLERYEKLAEAAYDEMYEARRPHDCYEDAMLHFLRAIELAHQLGRAADAERLARRKEHVYNVYTHQFRGV